MDINQGINLREAGRCEEALDILKMLLTDSPDNGEIYYQIAWCNDVLEKEAEAIPFYRKAIECGLDEKSLKGAYLGLGSTLRTLGNYSEAKKILGEAMQLFPQNNEFKVFYSMALYNTNEIEDALYILLNLLVDTTNDENISAYSKAIRYYSDKLSKVW